MQPRCKAPGKARWPLDVERMRAQMAERGVSDEALTARLRHQGFTATETRRVLAGERTHLTAEWVVRLCDALDAEPESLLLTPAAYYARLSKGAQE